MTSLSCASLFMALLLPLLAAEPKTTISLWPGPAPGEPDSQKAEADTTKDSDNLIAGRRLIRLGNVSSPTLSFYPAPHAKPGAPTILVFPGGGYHILALDLEGTEVCEWLNGIGCHAALVKYRVPRPAAGPPHARALQDAQRAMGLVRHRAREWGIHPDRIGVLGFSAGGHLAASLTASALQPRTYPVVDDADRNSCLPDFQVLVYPGYLFQKDKPGAVSPEVEVHSKTPKTFLVMTQDDGVKVDNVLVYYDALQRAKIPAELHIYPAGGHGYGLRRSELPVTSWPDRVTDWLKHQIER